MAPKDCRCGSLTSGGLWPKIHTVVDDIKCLEPLMCAQLGVPFTAKVFSEIETVYLGAGREKVHPVLSPAVSLESV
jgi:hypothetical protein